MRGGRYYSPWGEISPREAYERMAKLQRDFEQAYRKNNCFENAEKCRENAEEFERMSKELTPRIGDPSCYLTKACVEAEGLPDDCLELETLRNFRDSYLVNQQGGDVLISEYYSLAPRIIEAINKRPNAHEVFCGIFDRDIIKAVDMVQKGDSESALQHYKDMTNRLKSEFL